MERMEGMILDLTATLKLPRSPTPDARIVRAHIEESSTATPVFHSLAAVPPPESLTTHVPYSALPPGILHAARCIHDALCRSSGSAAASTCSRTFVGYSRGPCHEPAREDDGPDRARKVHMRHASWSRDNTAQALMIIQAGLPGYNWDNILVCAQVQYTRFFCPSFELPQSKHNPTYWTRTSIYFKTPLYVRNSMTAFDCQTDIPSFRKLGVLNPTSAILGWGSVAPISNSTRVPSKLREELCWTDFMVHQTGDILVFHVYVLPESWNWALNANLILLWLHPRTASALDPTRRSMDDKPISARGRFTFKLCRDYGLLIVKGVERFGPNSGACTSFQGERKTVIDHARTPRKSRGLFGSVYFDTTPLVEVTICGTHKNASKYIASATASAYFGPGSVLNRSLRVWAHQTNARADLVALLVALEIAPRAKTLHVSTRSECLLLDVRNGDILKSIIQAIKVGSAPAFINTKKNKLHGHFTAAKKLSEAALTLPRPVQPGNQQLRPMQPFTTQQLEVEKVTADIPDESEISTAPSRRPDFPTGHRGRVRLHEMREKNRKLIMEASSAAEFWKHVNRFIDPAPNPISVTADSVKDVFEPRLNPFFLSLLMHFNTNLTQT
ncbi:hypothetical protein K438DRAFT_1774703 [Mycena galopus ATCC 62051]|nr:hypothetical protein K438DRAFT_1774703 [Mycena galopus ATCC 62051]